MVIFILCAIGCLIAIISTLLDNWLPILVRLLSIIVIPIISLLLWAVITFLASGLFGAVTSDKYISYELASTDTIYAIQDNITGEGRGYLFNGYYNEDLSYFYCVKEQLGYKIDKVKAENSYIEYVDSNYRIETYKPVFANKTVEFFFLTPINDNRYVIYCPKGTIIEEFNIDLE